MASSNEPKRFTPASRLVPIQEIMGERSAGDGCILIMKDGSFRQLIRCGAINFEMKSPTERDGITHAFGEMVDSLDPRTPIQIVSHAKQLDTEAYVRQFEPRLRNDRTPPQVRALLQGHIDHFEREVKARNLLQRELYIAVPYKKSGGPVTDSVSNYMPFGRLVAQIGKVTERRILRSTEVDEEAREEARRELGLVTGELIGRMLAMGVWARKVDTDELIRVLYEIYHPGIASLARPDFDDSYGLGYSAQGQAYGRQPIGQLGPGAFQ